jgi:hypothetical protein
VKDAELAEVEEQLRAKRKKLALVGLVFVGAVLAWRLAILIDRSTGFEEPATFSTVLEVEVARSGHVRVRNCEYGGVEHCVATAKVRERNTGGRYLADLRVEPGAPEAAVAEVRALLESYEFTIR